jgi:ABC-2 type transport system ATP-binding protein
MEVLKLENVCKTIGKRQIVKNLNLKVNEGEIFGFLGPNGAGKTTTIKMIVGFLNPTSGKIYINGKDISKNRVEAIKNTAAIVEVPEMYPYLSAKENLKQLVRLDKEIHEDEIYKVLELVKLKERMEDKVKKFSLGMKQRLGIAQVIMGNKKIWILDEPTNGLDADGMIYFRNLFKKFVKERGVTIFISSHMLSEMEVLCDRIAFLDHGEIKSIEAMNDTHKKEDFDKYEMIAEESEKAIKILNTVSFVRSSKLKENSIEIIMDKNCYYELVKQLVHSDIKFERLNKIDRSLEDRYMEIIGESEKNNAFNN